MNDWHLGIVGAGQLARMTLQAAVSLGVRVRVLAANLDDPAAQVWPDVLLGAATSAPALDELAAGCEVVTFDHELVDAAVLDRLAGLGRTFRPGPRTVAIAQDKLLQRQAFGARGLPGPAWVLLPPPGGAGFGAAVARFAAEHGWPVVAKSVRGGYDGRGVFVLEDPAAVRRLGKAGAMTGRPLLAEAWVPVEREVAVLVVRRPGGQTVTYPVVQTAQRDGMCREVLAPAPISPGLAAAAQRLGLAAADAVEAVGILAVELLVAGERLFVNEIAARPHNSGHFSIEGAETSQFENHLRAVMDWPLGPTGLVAPAVAMVNVVGTDRRSAPAAVPGLGGLGAALGLGAVHVHLYGKQPRPGRKLGHVTAVGEDAAAVLALARSAAALLAGGPEPAGVEPAPTAHAGNPMTGR